VIDRVSSRSLARALSLFSRSRCCVRSRSLSRSLSRSPSSRSLSLSLFSLALASFLSLSLSCSLSLPPSLPLLHINPIVHEKKARTQFVDMLARRFSLIAWFSSGLSKTCCQQIEAATAVRGYPGFFALPRSPDANFFNVPFFVPFCCIESCI
jgi:hypothetical protein